MQNEKLYSLDVGAEDFTDTENTCSGAKYWPKVFIHMSVFCQLGNVTTATVTYLAAGKGVRCAC